MLDSLLKLKIEREERALSHWVLEVDLASKHFWDYFGNGTDPTPIALSVDDLWFAAWNLPQLEEYLHLFWFPRCNSVPPTATTAYRV